MSTSPLQWFRKNQKILLVVSGVLLMIVFTVGGVLDSFFSGGGQNSAAVRTVASTSFGDFTNRDFDEWAQANRRVVEFTRALFQLSGDQEKAKAFPIDPLNLSTTESRDRDILSRLAHAQYAEEKGMYVGEGIMEDYFNMLSNNELGNEGITIEEFSFNQKIGSLSSIKAHLKKELLAVYGRRLIVAGIAGGNAAPTEIWEGHRRLREKFQIEYMAIDVDFDASSAEPTAEEMQALYEEGADREPNIAIGPGFKSPRLASIGYFGVNRKKFLEAAKAEIKEADILQKYNEWVENEDFRVVDSSLPELPAGGDFQPQKGQSEDQQNLPQLNSPENQKSTPQETPEAQEPVKEKSGLGPAKTKSPQSEKPSPQKQPEPESQSNAGLSQRTQLVSFIQEKPQESAKNSADSKKTAASGSEQKPADGAIVNPQKTVDVSKGKQDPQVIPDSTPPKSVQESKQNDKPKIKPLDDEMRKTISEELARPQAESVVETALETVKTVLSEYLSDYDYYSDNQEEFGDLEVPDFEKLASENGLEYKAFEDVDYQTLEKTAFGKAPLKPIATNQNPGTVAINIFFTSFLQASTFEIKETAAVDDVEYVFWVLDRKYRKKVGFEDAKQSIVKYFQQTKAIEAAEEKASKITADVQSQNKRLSAEFGDQVTLSKEFGWMEIEEVFENMAAQNPQMAAQFQQLLTPKMGSIAPADDDEAKPLEGVDNHFMEKIFELEENETGYSTNFNKDKVYIFQMVKRTKQNPIQKDQFFSQMKFGLAGQTSQINQRRELSRLVSGEAVLEKYSVQWFGEPENQ
ncbi:MAG: hypothetical protein VX438_17530 [Planctomycetota bacterium]|nr:hypothetical protein [Planctomycetota bacterium]